MLLQTFPEPRLPHQQTKSIATDTTHGFCDTTRAPAVRAADRWSDPFLLNEFQRSLIPVVGFHLQRLRTRFQPLANAGLPSATKSPSAAFTESLRIRLEGNSKALLKQRRFSVVDRPVEIQKFANFLLFIFAIRATDVKVL